MTKESLVLEGQLIEDDASSDPDLNGEFFAFIDQFDREKNASGVIKVFRIPLDLRGNPVARTAQKTVLFTVPIGTMTLEDICARARDEHIEPGQHKIWIQIMAWQEGKAGMRFNRMIGIEKAVESRSRDLVPASNNLSAEKVLAMIREASDESQRRTEAMMRELMTARATPALDPMATLKALGEVAAVMAGRGPTAGPMPDMAAQMMQTMTMMKMMKEFFASDGGGRQEKESSVWGGIISAIKEVGAPMAAAALEDKRARNLQLQRALIQEKAQKAAAPTNPPAPDSTAEKPTEDQDVEPQTEPKSEDDTNKNEELDMRLIEELKGALPTLIDAASRGADVTPVASLLLTAIPEDDVALNNSFYEFIRKDTCVSELAVMNPEADKYRNWFEALRAKLLEEFDPDRVAS